MRLAISTQLLLVFIGSLFALRIISPLQRRSGRPVLVSHGKAVALFAKALGSKGSSETFFCESCGAEHTKWVGKCNYCKEWNTVKAFRAASKASSRSRPSSISTLAGNGRWIDAQIVGNSSLAAMSSISTAGRDRLEVFSTELGRVLGGGLVAGSVVLMAGEPGVGKSTLLLQLASDVNKRYGDVVYVSGEENEQQIALRAQRLGLQDDAHRLFLLCEVDLDRVLGILSTRSSRPSLVILDSIQTMRLEESSGGLGSVSQIRDCAAAVLQHAKSSSTPFILVGHVTKTGDVAGPRVLEHMVDAVVYLEGSDRAEYRLLHSVKNRFGSASEVGVLELNDKGLRDVVNPSAVFLTSSFLTSPREGSAVLVTMEGSRPLLAEVQCLVSYSAGAGGPGGRAPRRASDGFPIQRLLLLCAVIEKRLKLSLANRDVFLNVVGGLRVNEPSADLAVAVALVSSLVGQPVRNSTAFLGEVGLGGELRGGRRIEQRIQEAAKLGFRRVVVPSAAGVKYPAIAGAQVVQCETLAQALKEGLVGNVFEAIGRMRSRRGGTRYEAVAQGSENEDAVDSFAGDSESELL